MTKRTVELVSEWDSVPFDGGYDGLRTLSDQGFSGAVTAGPAQLFMLNGTVVGVLDGDVESFEDAAGTARAAPHDAVPLLAVMQDRADEPRAQYYTEDTPISEVDRTLADGNFTGFVELSENVLSGDYYLVYHQGRSMSVAWVGSSGKLITDEEAFEQADGEVGIYQVVPADIEPIDLPEPEPEPSTEPTGRDATAATDPGSETVETTEAARTDEGDADSEPASGTMSATESSTGSADEHESVRSTAGPPGSKAGGSSQGTAVDQHRREATDEQETTDERQTTSERAQADANQRTEAQADTQQQTGAGAHAEEVTDSDATAESEVTADSDATTESEVTADSDASAQTRADERTRNRAQTASATEQTERARDPAESESTRERATEPSEPEPTPERAARAVTESDAGPAASEQAADPADESASEAAGGGETSTAASQQTAPQAADGTDAAALETRSIPSLDPERSRPMPEEPTADTPEPAGSSTDSAPKSTGSSGDSSPKAEPNRGEASPDETAAPSRQQRQTAATAELEAELDERERDVARLESEVDELSAENEELTTERDRLLAELEEARAEIRRLEERVEAGSAAQTGGGPQLSAAEAIDGTNLFVRYHSKGEATLATAQEGNADRAAVEENLRLEYHTQFDGEDAVVDGQAFEAFLQDSIHYRFVDWLVRSLLYEIRDTGHQSAMGVLYEALPKIDRAELNGKVSVTYTEDGQQHRSQETFDVVVRDRMGNPLVVANINDARQPATEGQMTDIVRNAERVGNASDSLSAAFLVTSSFFEPEALETAEEATSSGLFSRDKRKSFVNLSRKGGYHLCLLEARNREFHLAVPEL